MKYIIFLVTAILFLSLSSLSAQKKSIKISEGESSSRSLVIKDFEGIVGVTDKGFYLLRTKRKGFATTPESVKSKLFIDKYDKNLSLLKSIEVKDILQYIKLKPKKDTYEFCYQDVNKDLWLFFSDKNKDLNGLYKQRLNPESFEFEEPILVSELKIKNSDLDRRCTYKLIQSEDKNTYAIYSIVGNEKSKRSYVYLEVFDNALKSKWQLKTTIPEYQEKKFNLFEVSSFNSTSPDLENEHVFLSNEGVLNIISKTQIKGDKKRSVHTVYSFQKDLKKPIKKALKNSEKQFVELYIIPDNNGNLKLAGYYCDIKRKKGVDGIFIQTLNPVTLEAKEEKFIAFSAEEKKSFLFESDNDVSRKVKRKIKKGKELSVSARNRIRSITTHKNNSITVISEYYNTYTEFSSNKAGESGNTREAYAFGNLQFVNISEEGELNWVKSLNKRQKGIIKKLYGFYQMFNEDIIHFMYNDFKENELIEGQINSTGQLSTNAISSLRKKGILNKHFFIPQATTQIEDDFYIGVAQKILKHRLFKISIE